MKRVLLVVFSLLLVVVAGCSKSATGTTQAKSASALEELPEQQVVDIVNAANAKNSAEVGALLKTNPKLVGAKFTGGGPVNGWPLIMIAAHNGDRPTAEMLIKAGADVNDTNYSEETALHYAVSGGHKEIVRILLAAKANVQVKNEIGATPLKIAVSIGKQEIVTMLKQAGAKE